jgi:hypothetical protein
MNFSKIISKCSFLGMDKNEIINEIKNKLRIKTIEYEEFFIKKKKEIYEYSIDKNKIVIDINSIFIDKNANPGIAIIFEVLNSTIDKTLEINENFKLRSKCINDKSENLGKISIDEKKFTLPNSIKLLKNEKYKIEYYPNEGYEFDHWEIINGKLIYRNNESINILLIQNNYGEIIAYYKKIGIKEEKITTSSIISLRTSTSLSHIKTTSSIKTQSLTSYKETKNEVKTILTLTITTSTVTSTITNVDILPSYKSESTSYKSESQTTIVTKTTTTTTFTIAPIAKQEVSLIDTIINSINDIGKHILHGLGFYEENISFSKATSITTKTEIQNPYKSEVTYEGRTISQTIKVEPTTIKTNTIITTTTSSINTKTSNTITTSTTSINTKTSSTSYDIDKHILNNLNYYNNNVNNIKTTTNTIYYTVKGSFVTYTTALYTYTTTKKITSSIKNSNTISGGGGSPKALLRDSLLFNEELYKEFLKKIEENKLLEYPYIPCAKLKYLVFKIVPVRIKLDNEQLEDLKIHKINVVINNYDEKDRNFIIKIEAIKEGANGLFLTEQIENLDLENIKDIAKEKIEILIKTNEIKEIKSQLFFLPPVDILKECGIINPHSSIYYKKYRLSIYSDSKKIYEKEIKVWSSSQSKFWKGFYKAIKDNLPSIALSTIALILIGIATSGSGIAVQAANLAMFAMFLYSVGMNIMEIYYAYIGYDSFNKFVNERYNIIGLKYGYNTRKFIENNEKDYIEQARNLYAIDRISDFFINIEISDLLKIGGIIEVDEEEKGYAAGKIFVAAYSFTTFAIGFVYSIKDKIANKGGIAYTKEIIKAWVTAPLIDAIAIFYKYRQIKGLKDKKIEISENNKIDDIANKLYEVASKNKEIESIVNNIENYVMDASTWSRYSGTFKKFLEENVKIDENINVNDFINKIKILKSCSEIFYKSLAIADKIYNGETNNKINGELSKDKVAKVLNAIGEEIKENRKIDETIFKEGLRKLGIEEVKLYEGEERILQIYKEYLKIMIEKSLGDNVEIKKGDYLIFRIFTEDKGPHFIIAEIGEPKGKYYKLGGVGFYKRIGSENFYIKIEDVIKNPKDLYNKLIKGKIEEIKINDNTVKILSENEIKIINEKTKLEKILKLENVELYFVDQGRFLGIKGDVKIEETGSEVEIAIRTDGDGNIVIGASKGEDLREVKDIDLDENRIKFYMKGDKCTLYFVNPLKLVETIQENGEWLISMDAAEAWFNAGENDVMKGAIGEKAGEKMSPYIEGCTSEGETAEGRPSGFSDVKIKLDGIDSPEEVKTCDLTGKSIKECNEVFRRKLSEAIRQIENEFKKEVFKNSKAGIVIIIGFDKNKLLKNPYAKYVKIDVLIAKVPSEKPSDYKILSAPEWFKKS